MHERSVISRRIRLIPFDVRERQLQANIATNNTSRVNVHQMTDDWGWDVILSFCCWIHTSRVVSIFRNILRRLMRRYWATNERCDRSSCLSVNLIAHRISDDNKRSNSNVSHRSSRWWRRIITAWHGTMHLSHSLVSSFHCHRAYHHTVTAGHKMAPAFRRNKYKN